MLLASGSMDLFFSGLASWKVRKADAFDYVYGGYHEADQNTDDGYRFSSVTVVTFTASAYLANG